MSNDSVLLQELDKLEQNDLKKVAALWNLTKLPYKEKNKNVAYLYEIFQNDFYLKGVLENLLNYRLQFIQVFLKIRMY